LHYLFIYFNNEFASNFPKETMDCWHYSLKDGGYKMSHFGCVVTAVWCSAVISYAGGWCYPDDRDGFRASHLGDVITRDATLCDGPASIGLRASIWSLSNRHRIIAIIIIVLIWHQLYVISSCHSVWQSISCLATTSPAQTVILYNYHSLSGNEWRLILHLTGGRSRWLNCSPCMTIA